MEFSKAYYYMLNGEKIKMPSWGGYWAWEDNTIMMHCKDGDVLDIRNSENVGYTFSFITSNEWVIAKEEDIHIDSGTSLSKDMRKPKFNCYVYNSNMCLYCDTKEKAMILMDYLEDEYMTWCNGEPYNRQNNHWDTWEDQSCYFVLRGEVQPKSFINDENFLERTGAIILNFDDFDWSDYEK